MLSYSTTAQILSGAAGGKILSEYLLRRSLALFAVCLGILDDLLHTSDPHGRVEHNEALDVLLFSLGGDFVLSNEIANLALVLEIIEHLNNIGVVGSEAIVTGSRHVERNENEIERRY